MVRLSSIVDSNPILTTTEPPVPAKKGRWDDFMVTEAVIEAKSPPIIDIEPKVAPKKHAAPEGITASKKSAPDDLSSKWLAFFGPDATDALPESKVPHPKTPARLATTPKFARNASPVAAVREDNVAALNIGTKPSLPVVTSPCTPVAISKAPPQLQDDDASQGLRDVVNEVGYVCFLIVIKAHVLFQIAKSHAERFDQITLALSSLESQVLHLATLAEVSTSCYACYSMP